MPARALQPQLFDERPLARPFLKWVGGKSQLLNEIRSRIPKRYNRYFEPFVGGGALYFGVLLENAYLSDLNAELINAYRVVQGEVEALIADLRAHRYERRYYYRLRKADRSRSFADWTPVERASRLIYLNKTCYNGLYRVNADGHFNTPFGKYVNPTIVDEENLRACSKALSGVSLESGGFHDIELRARRGDFVYFDPPYVPLSATSSFTSYAAGSFREAEQEALRNLCVRLDRRGVRFLLSNSSAKFVLELYRGFKIEFVGATRAINCKAGSRGSVRETLVRNY